MDSIRHETLQDLAWKKCQCFRGSSSFRMQDPDIVFSKLPLKNGGTFLDLGCGAGDYSIRAASMVGELGLVYALDLYPEIVSYVWKDAEIRGIKNIRPMVGDLCKELDIPNNSVDTCLAATVLHTIDFSVARSKLIPELQRILKPGGAFAVIECKKEESTFGPPMSSRISLAELEESLAGYNFSKADYMDFGATYFVLFTLDSDV